MLKTHTGTSQILYDSQLLIRSTSQNSLACLIGLLQTDSLQTLPRPSALICSPDIIPLDLSLQPLPLLHKISVRSGLAAAFDVRLGATAI